jgi:hypothetical protein
MSWLMKILWLASALIGNLLFVFGLFGLGLANAWGGNEHLAIFTMIGAVVLITLCGLSFKHVFPDRWPNK